MSEQEEPTTAGPPGLAGAVGRVVNRVAERRWGEVETAAGGGAGGAGGAGGVDWARVGAEMDAEMNSEMNAGTGSEGAGFLFLPMHLDLIVRCEALVGGGYGFWCPLWTSRGPSRLGVGGVARRGPDGGWRCVVHRVGAADDDAGFGPGAGGPGGTGLGTRAAGVGGSDDGGGAGGPGSGGRAAGGGRLPGGLVEPVRVMADRVAAADWEGVARVAEVYPGARAGMAEALAAFGRTCLPLPDDFVSVVQCWPRGDGGIRLACPLWTVEDGVADLEVHGEALRGPGGAWRLRLIGVVMG